MRGSRVRGVELRAGAVPSRLVLFSKNGNVSPTAFVGVSLWVIPLICAVPEMSDDPRGRGWVYRSASCLG